MDRDRTDIKFDENGNLSVMDWKSLNVDDVICYDGKIGVVTDKYIYGGNECCLCLEFEDGSLTEGVFAYLSDDEDKPEIPSDIALSRIISIMNSEFNLEVSEFETIELIKNKW